MQTLGFIVLGAFAVGQAVSLLARRMKWPWDVEANALAQIVIYVGVLVIVGYTAIRCVERGGVLYALAVVLVLVSLTSLLKVVALTLVVLHLFQEPDRSE